jgi:hypothetical protein
MQIRQAHEFVTAGNYRRANGGSMDIQQEISVYPVALNPRRPGQNPIQPLFSLNQQLLELLASSTHSQEQPSPLVSTMRDAFRGMDPDSRSRLAHGPLLIDAGFANSDRWSIDQLRRSRSRRDVLNTDWLSRPRAVLLARSTLFLGWYWVHTFPSAAKLLLGMSDACVAFFNQATLADVRRLSEIRYHWIRLRWEREPAIWQGLISLARNPPKTIPNAVTLRLITLVAADVRRHQHPSSAA